MELPNALLTVPFFVNVIIVYQLFKAFILDQKNEIL